MGQLKWYKRDPDAALSGMMGLSLEERGAYNTVLDLLYTRDGHLPDDERFIAGWLGADVRVWRRIRERLLMLGKLTVVGGLITNLRATSEIDAALGRVASAREAGLASAASRAASGGRSSGEIKDLFATDDEAAVATDGQLSTTTTTTRSDANASVRRNAKGQTDCPEDFAPDPSPDSKTAERMATWPQSHLAEQIEKFIAYHRAKGSMFKNWQAAWTTWVINDYDRKGERSVASSRPTRTRDNRDGFQRHLDRELGLD